MMDPVEEAIEITRAQEEWDPKLEAALRHNLSCAELDERGELSLPALFAKFANGNTFEVKSKRISNVVLNWPGYLELMCNEGAGLANRPRVLDDQHPWLYPLRLGVKSLQWLVGARSIDLGDKSAALVHELWIERKDADRVAISELAASQRTSSPAEVRALIESLTALGIVKLEGEQVVKCERLVLVAG